MKKSHLKLINFLKENKGFQWYGNDKPTKKLVNKLVSRNIIIKREQILDNGYIFREMKKI